MCTADTLCSLRTPFSVLKHEIFINVVTCSWALGRGVAGRGVAGRGVAGRGAALRRVVLLSGVAGRGRTCCRTLMRRPSLFYEYSWYST